MFFMVTTKYLDGEMDCVVLHQSELIMPDWFDKTVDYFTIKPLESIEGKANV